MTKAKIRDDSRRIRSALLRWYRANQRDLPWRRTSDPYRIWISETMLQQTRVDTVIPYYERFLDRFPDVNSLASAPLDDVLAEWTGLGYYTRARNLWRAASVVRDQHDGELPREAEALRALPGVGRYTAGAVASIAFDRPEPIVDGNVSRVLARVLGVRDDIRGKAGISRLWKEAERFVRGSAPGDFNQALMELGATVCTPRSPSCNDCPVAKYCFAASSGEPEALPVRAPRVKPKRIEAAAVYLERDGRALAVQRPPEGLLGGLWELPGGELRGKEKPATGLRRSLKEHVGLESSALKRMGKVEHVFTHRHLHLHVYRAEAKPGRVRLAGFEKHRWLSPAALARLPAGGAMRKALALANKQA